MITIEQITDFEKIRSISKEWNKLVEKAASSTIFSTFEWLDAWWQCFGNKGKLWLLLARENNKIIGIAPFVIRKKFKIFKIIEFIGTPEVDYADFIFESKKAERVLQAFFEYLEEKESLWDIINLKEMPSSSPTLVFIKKFFKKKNFLTFLKTNSCLVIVFPPEQLERRNLIQSFFRKQDLKRNFKKLENLGKLNFQKLNDLSEIEKLLPIFFTQHKKRWQKIDFRSKFFKPVYQEFYRLLTKKLFSKGYLSFCTLRLNEQYLAFDFSFKYQGKYYLYTPTFEIDFKKFSPGMILFLYLFKKAEEEGVNLIDFTRGTEAYKFRFTNEFRESYGIKIFKKKWLHLADQKISSLKREVKKSKIITKIYHHLKKVYEKSF